MSYGDHLMSDAAGAVVAGLRVAITELTDAQIKALPTTGIDVLAAPGAGKRNKILGISLLTSLAGGYTNIDATYADLNLQNSFGDYVVYPLLVNDNTTTPVIDQLTNTLGFANYIVTDVNPLPLTGVGAAGAASYILNNNPSYSGGGSGGWDDSPITLHMDNNGSGDLTGGNAANFLRIIIYYFVEDL